MFYILNKIPQDVSLTYTYANVQMSFFFRFLFLNKCLYSICKYIVPILGYTYNVTSIQFSLSFNCRILNIAVHKVLETKTIYWEKLKDEET